MSLHTLANRRVVVVQVEFERHILKPGGLINGKGLKPVAFKLRVNRVQLAPPHRVGATPAEHVSPPVFSRNAARSSAATAAGDIPVRRTYSETSRKASSSDPASKSASYAAA
jgi:hypothetical protein